MRTLAIQYPDPWGKPGQTRKISHPVPGGGVGAHIDRCIIPKIPRGTHNIRDEGTHAQMDFSLTEHNKQANSNSILN